MAVNIYRSTDVSAPTLNGIDGSLITVLDACLINGYGAKVAAGWTKEYTGTNRAAYRYSATGNHMYWQVFDDSPFTALAGRSAEMIGWRTLSALDTGESEVPTISLTGDRTGAQDGTDFRKAYNATVTSVPWVIFEDSGTVIFYTQRHETTQDAYTAINIFGKYASYMQEAHSSILCCHGSTAFSTNIYQGIGKEAENPKVAGGRYVSGRDFGSSTCLPFGISFLVPGVTPETPATQALSNPDNISGDILLGPIQINISRTALDSEPFIAAGNMLGVYMLPGQQYYNIGDTFSGKAGGNLAGKSFEVISEEYLYLAVDTTGPW